MNASRLNEAEAQALAALMDDTLGLSEIINSDDHLWLTDAVAYAVKTGDWLYVQHMTERHLMPTLIAKAIEKVETAESETVEHVERMRRYG